MNINDLGSVAKHYSTIHFKNTNTKFSINLWMFATVLFLLAYLIFSPIERMKNGIKPFICMVEKFVHTVKYAKTVNVTKSFVYRTVK